MLHRFAPAYTFQNVKLLEITCRSSFLTFQQYSALLIQYKIAHFGGFKIEKVIKELSRGSRLVSGIYLVMAILKNVCCHPGTLLTIFQVFLTDIRNNEKMSKIRTNFFSLWNSHKLFYFIYLFLGGWGGILNECQQTIFLKKGLMVIDKGEFQTKVINRNTFCYPCQKYCRCFKQ